MADEKHEKEIPIRKGYTYKEPPKKVPEPPMPAVPPKQSK